MPERCVKCDRYQRACSCPKADNDAMLRAMMEHADETMNFSLYNKCRKELAKCAGK